MPNLYEKSARLSIAVARISHAAAFIFGIIAILLRPPGNLPHPEAYLALGMAILCAITFFAGIVPAVIGWIDPASSPLAKKAFLWCLATPLTGLISATLTALLLRHTGNA